VSIPIKKLLIRAFGAVALGLLVCGPASAHHIADPLEAAALAPAAGAPEERLTGIVHRVTIDDRVIGSVIELYSVEQDDGSAVPIKGAETGGLEAGARVEVTGRRNGKTLFVSGVRQLAPPPAGANAAWKASPLVQLEGTLALLHADHFEEARGEFIFELHGTSGTPTTLRFHVVPEALHAKMQVVVSGRVAADGAGVEPESVTVVGLPPQTSLQTDLAKAPTTNNVLVILMSFTDSAGQPFTQAQVQSVFAGGSGSVAAYFNEVSFGQQLVNPTVTSWLSINAATPAGCNWQQMGTLGRTAANAAGYNTASYQNIVYVFPRVGACGWAGLAYIGASGVWINGYNSTSVYGHELGHNFGLLHAGSLRCTGGAIGGSCSVTEYGDPFDIMGNQSAMHFNAAQKLDLGWIGTGTVISHGAGSGTYVLSPIETAGGGVYAVRIPAASNRTYWLEYRQPIGFDAGLASYPNNGAQVRVASPFETMCSGCDAYSNDTQLLDMTPNTSAFTDAALIVGTSFADAAYGINISVLSATASGLTVQVSTPGGTSATSTALRSSGSPAVAGASVTFTATVTGVAPTGSVGFTSDGATIAGCSAIALVVSGNAGTAACSTSSLTAGTHSIVASYGGNAGNAASASAPLSQVINPAPPTVTTTALATSANPGLQGANVTFTAIVTGSAPTGAVSFADGGSAITGCASVALAGSGNTRSAACSTSNLTIGNHSVVATYGGDTANAGSASTPLSQAVDSAPAGTVWVEDSVPAGAVLTGSAEGWNWTSTNPAPFSGALAHQSALVAGLHQHYFYGASAPLSVGVNDTLYTYVYLDPANPPTEVMLQWYDGAAWEHRAYWGANNITYWGTDGTPSRRYMGPLPATGQWVRLAVPAAQVGLDGKSISGMAFTLFDGRATWDRAGVEAGTPPSGAWVDDAMPAGATPVGMGESWNWTSTNPAPFSGALAHQSALVAGLHQHYFTGASPPQSVGVNDALYAYVYLDPANPPTEVMLQWHDGSSWEHRAYWGANNVGWGVDGTTSRRYMGPLPATGQWVKLTIPATAVGLDGKSISGMAFTLYDGRATWDRAGIEAGSPPSGAWVDDAMPAGATPVGMGESWNWTSTNPAPFSGALAHQSALAAGVHQHYFTGASTPLSVGASDTLYAYVYLDPANPPTEVMLQWKEGSSWEHRAYWGANNITAWGIDGTVSRRYMGPVPATGQWVRLSVPAAQVGLDGKSVTGMAFTLYDGRATWDAAGK